MMPRLLGRQMRTTKFRRKRCAVIFLFNAVFVGIIFLSAYHHTHRLRRLQDLRRNNTELWKKQALEWVAAVGSSSAENSLFNEKRRTGEVTVLFWTKYFGQDYRGGYINRTNPECFKGCRMVEDRRYFGTSEAVVFHSRDMRKDDMPLIHPGKQIWIYMQQESPSYTKEDLSEYPHVFNWTMTYRKDSDIFHPYFSTLPVDNRSFGRPHFQENILSNKTKLVAWIVSNCHTRGKREAFVNELSSHIPVDIYGRCGVYSCDRGGDGCLPEIGSQYKFYLAFENSLCKDYITEKFSRALQYNLVPIVYGGADYHTLAPPRSYINAHDFPSVEALADYLKLLDHDGELYLEYFEWKRKFKVAAGQGWCTLCQRLQKRQVSRQYTSSYKNLEQWWHHGKHNLTQPSCYDPVTEAATSRWKLVDMVTEGWQYLRRWFYKGFLGY